jgi:hypothetical protein
MKMNRRQFTLIIMLPFAFLGCTAKKQQKQSDFEIIAEGINAVFQIELPQEVRMITVFCEGWQSHGFYVYFEIPSDKLSQVKTSKYSWQEIPTEIQKIPNSGYAGMDRISQEALRDLMTIRINHLFDVTKNYCKIHNNSSDIARWYYNMPSFDRPEKSIELMISAEDNGIYRCYFSDTDIRDYDDRGKLYNVLVPDKPATLTRP